MRIYKLKAFARFQRKERLGDDALVRAVKAAEDGLIGADLGGGLIKQRVARAGQGKSGSYRTVIAFRRGQRAVFLYGFAKSGRDNLDDDELEEWRKVGRAYLDLAGAGIKAAIDSKELSEVKDGQENEGEG
jgi:hypothetical protein